MRTISSDLSDETKRRPCLSNCTSVGRKPEGHLAPWPPCASRLTTSPDGLPPAESKGSRTTA
eukprot:scaffold44234_cov63-Phaeocystis_antarctica.AAC.2